VSIDWTALTTFDRMLGIIAVVSTQVLLGPDISKDQNWIEFAQNYIFKAVDYAHALKIYPTCLRPFIYRILPIYKKCRRACQGKNWYQGRNAKA
jgi:hypothetical protein